MPTHNQGRGCVARSRASLCVVRTHTHTHSMLRATAAAAGATARRAVPRPPLRCCLSTHHVGDDADALADIIKRHVVSLKGAGSCVFGMETQREHAHEFSHHHLVPSQAPTPPRPATPVLTSHSEALALYRAILRATAAFTWPDANGTPWRDVLRASARKEFDEQRTLTDPEAVARALVVGRDALGRAMEKLAVKAAGVEEGEGGRRR